MILLKNHLPHYAILMLSVFIFSCEENSKPIKKSDNNEKRIYENKQMKFQLTLPAQWTINEENAVNNEIMFIEQKEDSTKLQNISNILLWQENMPMHLDDSLYTQAAITEIKITKPDIQITKYPNIVTPKGTFGHFGFVYPSETPNKLFMHGYTFVADTVGYNFTCASSIKDTSYYNNVFLSIIQSFQLLK